jgi:hypothetical protein
MSRNRDVHDNNVKYYNTSPYLRELLSNSVRVLKPKRAYNIHFVKYVLNKKIIIYYVGIYKNNNNSVQI